MAENILRKFIFGKPVESILFVGERNRDASAAAGLLLNHYASLSEEGRKCRATSAGIWAEDGQGISERASAFLASRGVDSHAFSSRKFSESMCDEHQLTLALDMGVKGMLLFRKPEAVIYTLSEYALMGADITKASSLNDENYRQMMEELDEMIKRSLKRATRYVTF